jgi:hypothetical protein
VVSWASVHPAANVIAVPPCLPSSGHLRQQCLCLSLGMESPMRLSAQSVITPKQNGRVAYLFLLFVFWIPMCFRTDYSPTSLFVDHLHITSPHQTPW